jgi:hypothetical protein
MYNRPEKRRVVIPSGQQLSEPIGLRNYLVTGIVVPATVTSTAVTFQAAPTVDGTYGAVYDSEAAEVSVPITGGRRIGMIGSKAEALAPWEWVRLRTGSVEAAEREFFLVLKG